MASPQLEDGYFKIANAIGEALARTQLSGHESRVLWVLIRKTWGFNQKADVISLSQWETATRLPRRHVDAAIKRLETRNIMLVKRSPRGNEYQLQKDFERWDRPTPQVPTSTENGTSTEIGTSTENGTQASTDFGTKTSTENGTHKIHERHERQHVAADFLPDPITQANVLFPRLSRNHVGTIAELERAGWHIKDSLVQAALAVFVETTRLSIPRDVALRREWYKSIKTHLAEASLAELERAYPLLATQFHERDLTLARPGAFTKSLPAVLLELRSKAAPKPERTKPKTKPLMWDDPRESDT